MIETNSQMDRFRLECIRTAWFKRKICNVAITIFISVPCNIPWYTNYKTNYLHQCIVLKTFTL